MWFGNQSRTIHVCTSTMVVCARYVEPHTTIVEVYTCIETKVNAGHSSMWFGPTVDTPLCCSPTALLFTFGVSTLLSFNQYGLLSMNNIVDTGPLSFEDSGASESRASRQSLFSTKFTCHVHHNVLVFGTKTRTPVYNRII